MSSRFQLANAIRALSMDAVQQANSGHPGAPMGMADIAEVLWNDFLQHNPANPQWFNRDRFVLSNGHGSMILYALLHLSGYDLSIEDLKQFRQLHAKTPGHPELGHTPGVETTTGPLGQGIANAVGMAIAEKTLAHQFNRPQHQLIDHFTYVFLGDGCLMEGVSHEACSLAGNLGLGKLIVCYDDNGISIDGQVEGWFNENIPKRFEAYGWQVIPNIDGHDANAIFIAIEQAQRNTSQPTLICCKTLIGFGSPNKQGKADCHGAPLGALETTLTREALNWPYDAFEIPADIYQAWNARDAGDQAEQDWDQKLEAYHATYPKLADELLRRISGDLPACFNADADAYIAQLQSAKIEVATRKASQHTLNTFGPMLPELLGGSADLTGSNLTFWQGCKTIKKTDFSGNYLHYGVREFAMSATMIGIALHGGFIPYGGTFLVFMEYARNAVRMAALMQQRVLFVYTHDSIGLGEDGPTHQPVEQLANLRLTPNLDTWRPCDTVESAVAWKFGVQRREGPVALILSRQSVFQQQRSQTQVAAITQGGYILTDCEGVLEAIIIATGSEVAIAMQAATELGQQGRRVRVVSMPCTSVFERQSAAYRERVLPAAVTARVAVEAAHKDYWYKYVGLQGQVIGINEFGASAPAEQLYAWYGITTAAVVSAVNELV
jgi:transketolase